MDKRGGMDGRVHHNHNILITVSYSYTPFLAAGL